MHKGLFITFEGIDGCGKSTQARAAELALRQDGVRTVLSREPGGTRIAERIRAIILDADHDAMAGRCEALLYCAARAQHVEELIVPSLADGAVVLCDRFSLATLAYQGYGRGLSLEALRQIDGFANGGVCPDHTFVFDIPVELALQRREHMNKAPDRLEAAPRDFHERTRQGYLALAGADPGRFTILDGSRPMTDLTADVCRHIRALRDR